LNRPDDLRLEEIERIAASAGRFDRLLLSGGEPLLRDNLPEICRIFIKANHLSAIVVPTNGLEISSLRILDEIAASHPKVTVILAVSIDGLPATHEFLRGTPLAPTLEFLDRALRLRSRHGNLQVHVNTVINRINREEMPRLADDIKGRFAVDGHGFDVIRGAIPDKTLLFDPAELPAALAMKAVLNEANWTTKTQKAFHRLAGRAGRRALAQNGWGFPCRAGEVIAVLEADGTVRGCELKDALGRIQDYGYDLGRLLKSQEARRFRNQARCCGCTHPCFLIPSLRDSPGMTVALLAGLIRSRKSPA